MLEPTSSSGSRMDTLEFPGGKGPPFRAEMDVRGRLSSKG
jgi:hypothetical protein